MQPTLVLSAPHPGILYINGRFAGEVSHQNPLFRPVSADVGLAADVWHVFRFWGIEPQKRKRADVDIGPYDGECFVYQM